MSGLTEEEKDQLLDIIVLIYGSSVTIHGSALTSTKQL